LVSKHIKFYRGLAVLLLVGVLCVSAFSGLVAEAVSNPDSISVEEVRVFGDLWEDGDQLYVIQYMVMYDPDPSEDPEDTFFAGIYNGSTLVVSKPVQFYDHNAMSIYLDADSALTWEGSYTVVVGGNPTYFGALVEGSNKASWGLSTSHWISDADYICDYVIEIAETLEDSWGITLLGTGDRLNDTGDATFDYIIPNLVALCPDIYEYSITYPEPEPTEAVTGIQPTLTANYPPRLKTAFEDLGDWIGVPGAALGGVCAFVLYLILAGKLFVTTGSQVGSVLLALPFLIFMFLVGIIPLAVLFIFGLIVIVLAGIVFILGRFA
jgi:hypothetical protein